jgi:ABC-type oligopeptide transport system substrate-binding subunit
VDVPTPQAQRLMLRKYRQMSDRELATAAVGAGEYETKLVEQVLRERKLPATTNRIAGAAAVPRANADRVLADRVSKLPPAQARTLLRSLVVDATEDAETRLEALTLLATSGDPQLAEIARARALEDADPRVADLALRILRQSGTK